MMRTNQSLIKSITYLNSYILAGLLSVFVLASTVSVSHAQVGKVKATYQNWQLKCGTAPGSKSEKCALVQSVAAEDRPNVGLTVIFLKSIDGSKRLLRVIAPLGVLLPTGLGLKIDNADVGSAVFLKCGKIGCIAEVQLTDKQIQQFSAGSTAVFIIFQTPEAGIGIPIPLGGFKQGIASLR